MNWCWMSCYMGVTHGSAWIAVARALIDSIVYLSYLSFSVISNATHFICAVIWVCWLSFLDSSVLSYRIHVIGLLCWSMSPIPWLWCYFVIDSFMWLFDVAACILCYPDFTPCCDVVPIWSVADSVVLGVYVSACELPGDALYVTTLEVHAVSLINSWCTRRAWAKVIGLFGVKDDCVVVVRSVCMSC